MSAHVSERMSAYIDRELPPAERAAVDAHLRECGDCARAVEEMRAVDALARAEDVPAPPGYFDALPGRLRARLAPRVATRIPPWTLALAAGLVVAVLAPLALRQSPSPSTGARDAAPPSGGAPARTGSPSPRRDAAPSATPAAPEALASAPAAARPAPPATGNAAFESRGNRREPREQAFAGASPTAAARVRGGAPDAAAEKLAAAPPPPEAAPADEEEAEEEDATPLVSDDSAPPRKRREAIGAAAAGRTAAPPVPGADARRRALSSRTMKSAAEARDLREAWLAFVREDPEGQHADEARLRALEAGAAAWRLGGLPADRAQVEKDAREYLRRPDGAHKERVRALLAGLEP